MALDILQVEKIASLSRLSFDDNEKKTILNQLKTILKYVEKLNAIDTSAVPPTSHVLDISNISRDDIPSQSAAVDDILKNAPDRDDGFYKVPPIID